MEKKKTSWDYQRDRYKQVTLKFCMENTSDALLYHYLKSFDNMTDYIRKLIEEDMMWRAHNEA